MMIAVELGMSSILCIFILLSVLSASCYEDGSNTTYCVNQLDISKDPKMDSYLVDLCQNREQYRPCRKLIIYKDYNTLLVEIYFESGSMKIDELKFFIKDIRAARDGVIDAEIYIDKLIHIRNLPYVTYISLPRIQDHNEIISEAANCTKDIIGICPHRIQGIDGDGIVVAVLDSEFYRDESIKRELPEKIKVISSTTYTPRERHGTACAELIFDVAPNVTMYLVDTAETEDDFIFAIERLMEINEKIDIVSCSLDFRLGLFNGEDHVCKAVKNVTSRGTVWINSAGNHADKHWSGNFEDRDLDSFCDFNSNASDESINLTAKRGDLISAWLSWNEDWFHAILDYDLYLYAPDGTYTASRNPQEGYFGHKPAECVSMVAPSDGIYQIAIKRYKATQGNTSFQLFSSHKLDEYNMQNCSLGVIACCEDVITVGAVDVSTLKIENSSSRGPTINGLLKPDLVAPDNVTTKSYWPEKFSGTSTSAPYVAGCIALAMEKFGHSNYSKIKAVLNANAEDLGPKGPDYAYGHGLINISNLNIYNW